MKREKAQPKFITFYILNGNNGASYIFNASSWHALLYSLSFYKARTIKQKVLKAGLALVLFFGALLNRVFPMAQFLSTRQVNDYLALLNNEADFKVAENCSVLISPTRDKVIVNHHGEYFHKFAFAKSYSNVKREASIYKLLSKTPNHLAVSEFFDCYDNGALCSFKMRTPEFSQVKSFTVNDLVLPLQEFFSFSPLIISNVRALSNPALDYLLSVFNDDNAWIEAVERKLSNYQDSHVSLGLVHGDFKPWNILPVSPVVFFDFEEAKLNGLPLEDLLNYIIDPDVRHCTVSDMAFVIFNSNNVRAYHEYLNGLSVKLDYKVLLYLYLLGRIQFWAEQGQKDVATCYSALLRYVDESEYALES